MSTLSIAAVVIGLVGVGHSVLGELLIFRQLRGGGVLPDQPAPPLRLRHVRILWATWHIASVFGWGLVAVVWRIANAPGADIAGFAVQATGVSACVSAALVLFATGGRHPGWIGLLAAALLMFIA